MKITPEKAALKAWSARECENLMNRYEWLLSHSQFEAVMALFATHLPDCRVEYQDYNRAPEPYAAWEGTFSF